MIGKKTNKQRWCSFFGKKLQVKSKSTRPLKLDVSLSGYRSWADRFHVKPVLAGGLIFVFIGGLALQNVSALFGFGANEEGGGHGLQHQELVSILVEKELFESEGIEGRIERYAQDIEKELAIETVLIPISKNISPKDIWEGNMHLYFNGFDEINDKTSSLVGTILVGDVPLPTVEKRGSLWTTIYPYTDMVDPLYRWDEKKDRFVFEGGGNFQPEIWHAVIKPSTLDTSDFEKLSYENKQLQREAVKKEFTDWFDRNHDWHQGKIKYGQKVLLIDQTIARQGLPTEMDQKYQMFIKHIDDILYLRFNKHWAKDIMDVIHNDANPDPNASSVTDQFSWMVDVRTKQILTSVLKHYRSYFSNYLSRTNSAITKAGRYGAEDIDTSQGLISKKDLAAGLYLQGVNYELEEALKNALEAASVARDVSVDTHQSYSCGDDSYNQPLYWNGVLRSEMNVEDCSLLRGKARKDGKITTQMVEANRTFDRNTAGDCSGYDGCCADNMQINLENGALSENSCNTGSQWVCATTHQGAQKPVFSLAGTREVLTGKFGVSGCETILNTSGGGGTHTFDSLMIHDEPRAETINVQIQDGIVRAMPIDDPRGFSFYDHGYRFHRINFIDTFDLRQIHLDNRNKTDEEVQELIRQAFVASLSQKISEINTITSQGNTLSTDTDGGILSATIFDSVLETLDVDLVVTNALWLDRSIQEKHNLVVEYALGEQAKARAFFFEPSFEGYEIVQFMTETFDDEDLLMSADIIQREPSQKFLELKEQDESFRFKNVDPPIEVFEKDFTKEVSSYGNIPCDESLDVETKLACKVQNTLSKGKNVFVADGTFRTTNEIKPLVDTLRFTNEDMAVASFDRGSVALEIEILDKEGKRIESDFETEVTLESSTFAAKEAYEVFPFTTVKVQKGLARFWLVPRDTDRVGSYIYKASLNTAGRTLKSEPLTIRYADYQTKASSLSDDWSDVACENGATVLDLEGIPVEVRALTQERTLYRDASQGVLFTSEDGEFIGDNPADFIRGKSTIRFVPTTKAGVALITATPEDFSIAPTTLEIPVHPGPAKILRFPERPSVLLPGGDFVPVTVELTDIYGNTVEEVSHTLNIQGENIILKDYEEDSSVSIPLEKASFTFFVRTEKQSGTALLQISSTALDKDKGQSIRFVIANDLSFERGDLPENMLVGEDKYEIEVRLPEVEEGTVRIPVQVSDPSLGYIPSFIDVENGIGKLSLRAGQKAGSVDITLGGNGIKEETFALDIAPQKAVKLEMKGSRVLNRADEERVLWDIQAVDVYGNVDHSFVGEVEIRINESDTNDTLDEAVDDLITSGVYNGDSSRLRQTLIDQNQRLKEQPDVFDLTPLGESSLNNSDGLLITALQKGIRQIEVLPSEYVGNSFLSITHSDLIPETAEIFVEEGQRKDIFLKTLQPEGLASFILGMDAGNMSQEETPFALDWLLKGKKTQAVTTLLADPQPRAQLGFISPNGEYSPRLLPKVLQEDQLSFSLSDNADTAVLAEGVVQRDDVSFLDNVVFESQNDKTVLDKDTRTLWFDGLRVLQWSEQGGILFQGEDVTIEFIDNNVFYWNVYQDYHHVARIQYVWEEGLLPIVLEGDKKGLVLKQLYSGILLESGATLSRSNDMEGVFFWDTESKEPLERRLGSPYSSIENAHSSSQALWKGDWKPGALLSAGNSLGKSVQSGASDNLIHFGDPSVRFKNENTKSSLGLTDDVGTLLHTFGPEEIIESIVNIDFNGDKTKDLLVLTDKHAWILYQETDYLGQFLPPKEILRPTLIESPWIGGADYDRDGLDDLIALHEDGRLYWYKNKKNIFEDPEEIFLEEPVYPITSLTIANLDAQYKDDFVLTDSDANLWGVSIDNAAVQKVVLFDDFSPGFEPVEEQFASTSGELNPDAYPTIDGMSTRFDSIRDFSHYEQFQYKLGEDVPFSGVTNTKVWNDIRFTATSEDTRIRPYSKVRFQLELLPSQDLDGFTFRMPGFYNTDNELGSWQCEGCNDITTVLLTKDALEINSDRIEGRKRIVITWNGVVKELDPIRYVVDDFVGNDGIDDVAVAQIIGGEEKIIQFVSEPGILAYRKQLIVSNDPSFLVSNTDSSTRNIGGQISGATDSITKPVGNSLQQLTETVQNTTKPITDIASNGSQQITQTAETIIKPIQNIGSGIGTSVGNIGAQVSGVSDSITKPLGNSLQQLTDTVNNATKPVTDLVNQGQQQLTNTVNSAIRPLENAVQQGQQQLTNTLESVTKPLNDLASQGTEWFEKSQNHAKSIVSSVSRVDIFNPKDSFKLDPDGDGVPSGYDLTPSASTVPGTSQGAVSQQVNENEETKTNYTCGDPRCGTTTESQATQAPGVTTTQNHPEATPGTANIGQAIYWLPPTPYATQITSVFRMYQGTSSTGKSYTSMCFGTETDHLASNVWNPNCTLVTQPTTAGSQSCGSSSSGSTAQLEGLGKKASGYLLDQANNLFANDKGRWNKGQHKPEQKPKNTNLTIVGSDVIGTFTQNQYARALERWKLPKFNVYFPKPAATENLLKGVNPYQNIQDSGHHNLRTRTVSIPYPVVSQAEFCEYSKNVFDWIKRNQAWEETVLFQLETDTSLSEEEKVLWQEMLQKAQGDREAMRENIEAVRSYLTQAQALEGSQKQIQEVLEQTQVNQDAIAEMYNAWIEQVQQDLQSWVRFRKDIGKVFKGWEVHTKKLNQFSQSCATCSVNRSTLIEWLVRDGPLSVGLNGFEKDGGASIFDLESRPPDVTMDLSRVAQGNNVQVPNITLRPVELAITSMPQDYPSLTKGVTLKSIPTVVRLPEVTDPIDISAIPQLETAFPRLSAGLHTANELQKHFIKEGETMIPAPPKDFQSMGKRLQSSLKAHTAQFGTLCSIMQGSSYIPEWFVRPNIELATNRQSLTSKDWSKKAQNKGIQQKSTEDRVQFIDYDLKFSNKGDDPSKNDAYATIDAQVDLQARKMHCLVEHIQYSLTTKHQDTPFVCSEALASHPKERRTLAQVEKQLITYDYEDLLDQSIDLGRSDESELSSLPSFRQQSWIASLANVIEHGEDRSSQSWTASLENTIATPQHTEPGTRKSGLYYYNKKTDQSDLITTYDIEKEHAQLLSDINKNGENDIVWSNKGELYVKFVVQPVLTHLEKKKTYDLLLDEEVFKGYYVPLQNRFKLSLDGAGNFLRFKSDDLQEQYLEWQYFENPLSIEPRTRTAVYLNESENEEASVQKNPVTVVQTKGFPKGTTKSVPLPLQTVEECELPEYQVALKRGTKIVGTVGTSRLVWTDILGEQGEIILKAGEYIEQGRGSVCATSGKVFLVQPKNLSVQSVLTRESVLTDGSKIVTGEGEEVTLVFAGGYTIKIPENQEYHLRMFEKEDVPAFLKLNIRERSLRYGRLISANKGILGTSLPTGVHQSLLEDDTNTPVIRIAGGLNQTVPLYKSFSLDARQTTDEGGIESVWWDFDGGIDADGDGVGTNDNDFPGWSTAGSTPEELLFVDIPAQSNQETRLITINVQDESGNIAEETIEIQFEVPKIDLLEVSEGDSTIEGMVTPVGDDLIASLWRQRADEWETVRDPVGVGADGTFVWEDVQHQKGVLLYGDEGIIDVVSNGRPVIETGEYELEVFPTTAQSPFRIGIRKKEGDALGGVLFGFDETIPVVIQEGRSDIPSSDGISVWSDVFRWKEVEGEEWQSGTVALVDNVYDETFVIITPKGEVYAVDESLSFSLSSVSDVQKPLAFLIKNKEEEVLGGFVFQNKAGDFQILR